MSESRIEFRKTYDVIIAGAGPAGCVLANRLSEEPDKDILLIEAGPDAAAPGTEHPDVLDPFCLNASYNRSFHWPGLAAEMSEDLGDACAHAATPYIQGYGVGGASNINGMGADRGQPDDYDEWRNLGAAKWGWEDVLPYFKKLEHDLDFLGPMHGDRGPMPVHRLPRARWAPFAAAVGEAMQRRGFPFIDDYMTDFREGLSAVPTNCLHQRISAAMAYLTRDVRLRPNLTILANARAERLGLHGRHVNGVYVTVGGTTALVRGRQIILACGAIQSPALLTRSGIGPSEQLVKHGIAVMHDLPGVGTNLQNHPELTVTTYLPKEAIQPSDNACFLQNWLRFSSHYPGCAPNDMHLMVFNKCAWHVLGSRVGAIVVSVLQPYSRGRVELASADPAVAPRVRFNLLADSRDEERLVAGLRFVLELLTDPLVTKLRHEIFVPNNLSVSSLASRNAWNGFRARTIARILDRTLPRRVLLSKTRVRPEKLFSEKRLLREFVRKRASLQYHVCGTCRMGRVDDRDAVVDYAGRVHGIAALRIVDASIFPTVPRGYTHFIVLMAAEKIADAIKADWRATHDYAEEEHSDGSVARLHIDVEALEKNGQ